MDESKALEALAALAQETRMNVFRALVRAHPEGIPAGEVAVTCGVPHNTMSSHLAILTRAGLTSAERKGRVILYRANLEGFRSLIGFLTRDCCGGRPEICSQLVEAMTPACCP